MKPSDFLTELSNDKLTQYKTAAAADASKADKEGDFKKGDKRFSGIVKATKKQFDNDAKKDVAEGLGGNWYIRVNGKILNDTKFKPVIFSSEDEARSHAMKLADKKRIPLSQIKLTKSWMDAPEPGVAEGSEQKYLWHGSRQKIPMLEPRQSVDTGGAAGSNQNAIYATSDPKVAIAVGGLTTPDSDTAMFPNDPQMVLFSGKIRKGENVYLHKLPFYSPDGKPQFVQGAHDREFYSIPGVKGIKPTEIKAVPVDKYLNLIRKATPADLELRKKNMKEQGVAEEKCPHCNGPMFSEMIMNEKKDACYYKVKSRYKVWPSAYASGALVKCRNKGANNWGNGGKKNESSILEGIEQADESLHDWFNKEKWVRMDTKGKIKGPCAREPGEGKPKCLPQAKAHSLGKKGRASAAARKRREDPNPDRSGKAINVNTKKK